MTNKPMLSVEMRALLERLLSHDFAEECQECGIGCSDAWGELRALLDKEVDMDSDASKHQGDPVAGHCTHPQGCKSCSWCGFKAEQTAPVADHTQCEECKGWGYHENHYEGGGTECGECGGSGKATAEQFSGDTVVCRRYHLEQSPGQNFYHYDLEPVYGSVPVTVSELITMAESAPVAVVLPDRLKTEPFTTIDRGSKNYKAGYNAALAEVARLNEVKP